MAEQLEHKNPIKQRKPSVGRGGVPTPPGFEAHPERRHNGAWKKTETARYKLEQAIKLSDEELDAQLELGESSSYDISMLNTIKQMRELSADIKELRKKISKEPKLEDKVKLSSMCMGMIESLARIQEKFNNQVYGQPKQKIENTIITPKPLVDLTKKAKK